MRTHTHHKQNILERTHTYTRTVAHAWHFTESLTQIHESLKLSTADNWSETALTHISNTHTLTPPWLCRHLTLGEGGCCLMVWVHSRCVKSFPATGTVRGAGGYIGWPQMGAQWGAWWYGTNPSRVTQRCVANTAWAQNFVIYSILILTMWTQRDKKFIESRLVWLDI